MDTYIYAADLYCSCCTTKIKADLEAKGAVPEDPSNESSYDSEDYPKYAGNGGQEADSPQNCVDCGCFLENGLTAEGLAYVHSAILETLCTGHGESVKEWAVFYDISLSNLFAYASDNAAERSRERERVALDSARDAMRRAYAADIRGIADEFMKLAKLGEFDDGEAADEWLHETIDGCQRVIFTQQAQEALLCSSNEDAYADDFGTDGMIKDGNINWSALAFCTVRADVLERLQADGIEIHDEASWKPSESDE